MSSSHPKPKDRSLQKALASKIVDEYFFSSESWLRAILRMCIFSMAWVDRHPALLIECPNQAVAKRLSRKTLPLQEFVQRFMGDRPSSKRVLICAPEANHQSWRCFDTKTNSWRCWEDLQKRAASGGDGGRGKKS